MDLESKKRKIGVIVKNMFAVKNGEIRINLSEVDYTIDENQLLGIQEKVEFVPVREYSFNSNMYLTYEVQNFISLKEYLQTLSTENEEVQFEKYTDIVKQVVKILLIGTKYLFVSQDNIVLDLDTIFIDRNTTKLKFVYAPFIKSYYSDGAKKRLASLIESTKPYINNCSHAVTLQSNITKYLNNDEGDFRHLYKQIILWENKLLGREPVLDASQEKKYVSNTNIPGKQVLSKKLKKEFLLTAAIFQVILVVLLFLFNKMGIFEDSTEGSFSVVRFVGSIFIVGLLVEYCLYKFSIENKSIFNEVYVPVKDTSSFVERINNKIGNFKEKMGTKKEGGFNKLNAKKQSLKKNKIKDSRSAESNKLDHVSTEKVSEKSVSEKSSVSVPESEKSSVSVPESEKSSVSVPEAVVVESEAVANLIEEHTATEEFLAYILLDKDSSQEKYDITKNYTKIGRRDDNDIIILKKHVSRVHAYIEKKDDKYFIADRGSFNKTYLNDIALRSEQKCELKDGDEIRFANINAVFKIAV